MTPAQFQDIFLKITGSVSGTRWAHGKCFMYAYCFTEVVGGTPFSYLTRKNSGHCFISYEGKFWDAESYDGKSSWKDLQPWLKRASNKLVTKHRSTHVLKNVWKMSPEQVKECEKIINQIKLNHLKSK